MPDRLVVTDEGPIRILRIQRPEVRNAIDSKTATVSFVGADQTLDVHLSWLRRKLGESAARPRLLRTVRGVGVMLVPPA